MKLDPKIQKAMNEINKKYGDESVKMGGMQCIDRIPTNLMTVDRITGGGIPRGRFTIIWGPEMSGKTSFGLYLAKVVDDMKGKILIVDNESAHDSEYALHYGLNPDNCIYCKPDTLEQAGDTVKSLAPLVDYCLIDSITAVGSKQEVGLDLDDNSMALTARKLSQFFRMTVGSVGKSRCAVVLIAQARTHGIGGLYPYMDYSGGKGLRHYNSLTLAFRRGSKQDNPTKTINGKKVPIGFPIKITVDKTRISDTEKQSTVLTFFTDIPHFRSYDDLFRVALLEEIIERAGAWYKYGDIQTQGQDDFISLIAEDTKLFEKIKDEVMKKGEKK